MLAIFFLLLVIVCFVTPDGIMAAGMFLLNWIFGTSALLIFCKKEHWLRVITLFTWILDGYFLFAIFCNMYRFVMGYEFIGSLDGIGCYLPYTRNLLASPSSGIYNIITEIYTTSSYSFVGSILLLFMAAGSFSEYCRGDMLYAMQLSLIGISALVPIIVYHLFLKFDFPEQKSFRYALFFAFFTSCFYQSSYIVRDMPITLAYTAIIYLYFDEFKWSSLIKMILLLVVVGSLRMASAMFAVLLIIFYLLTNLKSSSLGQKISIVLCSMALLIYVATRFSDISMTMSSKASVYFEKELLDQGGASTLSMFNVLPPGISHFCKVLYDQFSPYPCFRNMVDSNGHPECYNLGRWPELLSTPFRYFLLVTLFYTLFCCPKIRSSIFENRKLSIMLLIGILFLCLQSSTMGDRRKMGCYIVFFLTGMMGWEKMNQTQRNNVIFAAISLFSIMQLFGSVVMLRARYR